MKKRYDAWTPEDDLILAETVLRYIREGNTQLAAFEEAGDKLNRTAAACGFRWNAEVRKRYTEAIELAKKQRKEHKRAQESEKKEISSQTPPYIPTGKDLISREDLQCSFSLIPETIDQCISFLQAFKYSYEQSSALITENVRLKKENEQLRSKERELEAELKKISKKQQSIQEDYQILIDIIKCAQKLSFEEEQSPQLVN